ncbi:MAG: hypothetical protein AB1401_09420 [Thermodesulfobacteriota bacterium]
MMGIWVGIIVFGFCAVFSFYMAYLAFRTGSNGAFLFTGFGLLFGVPFITSVFKALSKRSAVKPEPESVRFVPHWFMMTAIIFIGLVILASIVINIIKALR